MPTLSRKRAHPRYQYRVPVRVESDQGEVLGFSVNMSLGGMLLEVPDPFPFGTKLNLRFRLPGVNFDTEVEATVRWNKEDGVGLQFGSFRAKDVRALNKLFKQIREGVPPGSATEPGP